VSRSVFADFEQTLLERNELLWAMIKKLLEENRALKGEKPKGRSFPMPCACGMRLVGERADDYFATLTMVHSVRECRDRYSEKQPEPAPEPAPEPPPEPAPPPPRYNCKCGKYWLPSLTHIERVGYWRHRADSCWEVCLCNGKGCIDCAPSGPY
jgi:hypothetical protein